MKLDFVISLEKCVALFSYRSSSSVEHIVYFYLVRDLDTGLHYLPSPINMHCIKSKYSNKTNFEALVSFREKLMHLFSLS